MENWKSLLHLNGTLKSYYSTIFFFNFIMFTKGAFTVYYIAYTVILLNIIKISFIM